MPSLSLHSLDELRTLDGRLQAVLLEVIKYIDFKVIEGARTIERQRQLVAQGKSQTLNSKHLIDADHPLSRAVDIAPYPVNWNDSERFVYFAGWIMGIARMMGHKLRWGGDWDSDTEVGDERFRDLGHFELVEP